ncbi:MAG: hypothetical protein DMF49_06920, partial [Acidobacteria bacterium]
MNCRRSSICIPVKFGSRPGPRQTTFREPELHRARQGGWPGVCQAKSCQGEITPGSCQAKSLTASAARPYKEPVTPGRQILRNLTFANQLTFLRLVSIPFLALALLSNRHGLALGLFAAAALTDAFDGLIARILKQKTALGALLDPAADKMLLTCSLVLLSLPDHMRIAPDFTLANRLP